MRLTSPGRRPLQPSVVTGGARSNAVADTEASLLRRRAEVAAMPPSFRHGHTLVEQSAAESAAIRGAFKRSAQRREHVLPPTASSSPSSPSSPPPASARDFHGEGLSPRARGWLKHLYRKAAAPHGPGTADDWSLEGGGSPHAWWDKKSGAPMNRSERRARRRSCRLCRVVCRVCVPCLYEYE